MLIWADEKYNTQKNPCVVFATQKNPASFIDPKKSLLAKMSDPKNPSDPPPSLKYVSGAPGLSKKSFVGFQMPQDESSIRLSVKHHKIRIFSFTGQATARQMYS